MKIKAFAVAFFIAASILVGCDTEEEKFYKNANNSPSRPQTYESAPRYGDFIRQTREVDGNNVIIFRTFYVGYETRVEYYPYDRVRSERRDYTTHEVVVTDRRGGVTTTSVTRY